MVVCSVQFVIANIDNISILLLSQRVILSPQSFVSFPVVDDFLTKYRELSIFCNIDGYLDGCLVGLMGWMGWLYCFLR